MTVRIPMNEAIARSGDITTKAWFNTPGRKPPARPEHIYAVLDAADHPLTVADIVHAVYGVTVSPNHDREWNRTRQQLHRLKQQDLVESQFSTSGLALYWVKGRF